MIKWTQIIPCSIGLLLVLAASPSRAENHIQINGAQEESEIFQYLQSAVIQKNQDTDNLSLLALRQDTIDALKSKGFYDATVQVHEGNQKIQLDIHTGSLYSIHKVQITGYKGKIEFRLKSGMPILADDVLKEQKRITNKILSSECFYSMTVRHEVTLDHKRKSGDIVFIVDALPSVSFGKTTFRGSENISSAYLKNFIKYKEAGCWNRDKIEETKSALLGTGLLSSVQERLPEKVKKNQNVDIVFDIKERASRSVRLGASYYTDEGPGLSASWMHKNLFGSGEELTTELKTSLLIQSLGIDFSKPFLGNKKQSLSVTASLAHEDTDAFKEVKFNGGISLDRTLSKFWQGSLGVSSEITEITDKTDSSNSEIFSLLSFPGSLTFDNRDNLLDPHHGLFARFGVESFADILGNSPVFIKSQLTASSYFKLTKSKIDPVLALRGSVGSITGGETSNIPATKRFFAGGGNSIRGFEYLKAGPSENGDPVGGKSLIETSAEMRFKITSDIGGVAFIDGGNVYNGAFPDFKDGYFWGAGIGARYYTGFGPIRFDIATPLNKREEQPQSFQIYISIGQAF